MWTLFDKPSIDWWLMHRADGEEPAEFFEVRRFRNQVWVAEGAVSTFGQSRTIDASSPGAADQQIIRLLAEKSAEGFFESGKGSYRPGRFDFEELKAAVRSASRAAFGLIRARHPHQKLYGFGLTTDEVPMTLAPMAQTIQAVEAETDEAMRSEAEWNLQAWSIDDGGGFFDIAYRMLLRQSRGDIPFEIAIEPDTFSRGAFEAFVGALEDLRAEGIFAEGEDEALLLLVQPSDSEPIEGMIERLNADPAVAQRYYAENA